MRTSSNKEEKEKLISQLNERLINCIIKNKPVAIHLQSGKVTTRTTIVPESVNFNKDV